MDEAPADPAKGGLGRRRSSRGEGAGTLEEEESWCLLTGTSSLPPLERQLVPANTGCMQRQEHGRGKWR